MNIRRTNGFTIVEMAVVIIVIGILAAITAVAYGSVQERARDAQRVSDLAQLKQAMDRWVMTESKLPHESGAGYNGNGGGWVYASTYPETYENIFLSKGFIKKPLRDPSTPIGSGSYMFYRCNSTSEYYAFLAKLEYPDDAVDNEHSRWTGLGCSSYSTYGMNYARIMRYK